jgi:hypothetical protein
MQTPVLAEFSSSIWVEQKDPNQLTGNTSVAGFTFKEEV